MHRALSLFGLTVFSALAFGQNSGQPSKPAAPSASATQVPVIDLSFDEGTPIPGAPKSLALAIPIHCTADGSAIIQGLDPTNPNSPPAIFKITPDKQTILYHLGNLPGLSSVAVWDIYPIHDDLITLIAARPVVFGQPDNDNTKPLSSYIAIFDEHGMKTEVIPLDLPFVPLKIARFPSGEYLAEGRRDKEFALAFLNSDGTFNRYIDIYNDLPVTEKSVGSYFGGGQQAVSRATLRMFFVPAGDNILVVPFGTNLPIVELSKAGFVRSLNVAHPKDKQLGYFISATPTVWTMRLIHASQGGLVADGITIYDVSSEDGKLIRQYSSPLHPGLIACHEGKSFTTFKVDEKSNQLLLLQSR